MEHLACGGGGQGQAGETLNAGTPGRGESALRNQDGAHTSVAPSLSGHGSLACVEMPL